MGNKIRALFVIEIIIDIIIKIFLAVLYVVRWYAVNTPTPMLSRGVDAICTMHESPKHTSKNN